ncbi:P27 family phage terminase small subunit [Microvirga sp. M2]|uniref:P27 family phage terminase small subunit n=1 Tax=Microvirga sp. M2 TaxID=3073270 RepID=UPI0039C14A1A
MGTVEAYCLAAGTVRRSQATITSEGDTINTNTGTKRHPAIQTMFQALTEQRRLAAELGLTPASRMKAGQPPEGEEGYDDPYSELGI